MEHLNEELSIKTYLKILNEIKDENFSNNFIQRVKKEKNFTYLFYLLRAISDIESEWYWSELFSNNLKFIRYLYENNKISKKFYKRLTDCEDINNSDIVFEELERNIEILNDNNVFIDELVYFNSANYLYALYIFDNSIEYDYFFDKFLPNKVEEIEEERVDGFFLNNTKELYDIDLNPFEKIKIYFFDEDEYEKRLFKKDVEIQEKEDMNTLKTKSKIDELEDMFDYLIEVEDDVKKIKKSIKKLKTNFKEIIDDLNDL